MASANKPFHGEINGRVVMMNEKQRILVEVVMDAINETLELYKSDPTFAPADWILENWWNTLSVAITSSSSPSEDS